MAQFMECRCIETRSTLERGEAWQTDIVITGPIVCLAKAFPDGRAGACHKSIDRGVAFVPIAWHDVGWRHDARGEAFTLINVEHDVFPPLLSRR